MRADVYRICVVVGTLGVCTLADQIATISVRAAAAPSAVTFRDVAVTAGLEFVLNNSPTPEKRLPETMAGGVAAFDYDGDTLTDIYFTNGASLPSGSKDSPKYANRLYRNLGGMRFEDVTARAHVAGSGYSISAHAADYDNDGHVDLFVAGLGGNVLYRNRGDGAFDNVTAKAGIKTEVWSVGAAWFDFDNDGWLDVFVVNYLRWSPDLDRFCGDVAARIRVYCHPKVFDGLPNRLYRNQGDGTFRDVSVDSGIVRHVGKGMAAAVADYDRDGHVDVFVPNDKMPNFLFRNLGNGRFEEVAFQAGVALTDNGAEISGMGTDFRDYNNDGLPDLVMTALSGETFPLFQNKGSAIFADSSHRTRMGSLSRTYAGWGIGMFDFNNDGWKDIFTANSHVNDRVEAFEATRYKQHNAMFLNRATGEFEDVSQGVGFAAQQAHRGSAFADFNSDGKIDIVVSALGVVPELWENATATGNTWLILRLRGTRSNRDGIGTEIRIADQHNHMTTSVGYASSSHFGVHFGTGTRKQVDRVEIRWPSGIRQSLANVRTNQVLDVREPRE